MQALRRVRREDNAQSSFIYEMSLQTFMAIDNKEIDPEIGEALLCVFHRASNSILAKRGVWSRMQQRRYNRRHSFAKLDGELLFTLACLAGFALSLFAAYLITR